MLVRVGREPADSLKDGPFRENQRFLSGTVGTEVRKVRAGREKVKRPRAKRRVFRQGSPNWRMREIFVPGVWETETKVRVGREKPKRPKAKKKSQRLNRELQTAITFDSKLRFSQKTKDFLGQERPASNEI
ncbi:hypothetical protein KI387_009609, partial [Taxus chinensis]